MCQALPNKLPGLVNKTTNCPARALVLPERDVTAEIKRPTNGCGADVVLDAVGGCSHHSYPGGGGSGPMAGAVFGRITGAS